MSLGSTLGVFGDCDIHISCPPHECPVDVAFWGGRGLFHSWASLCDGGWVFTTSDQRLLHTPKAFLLLLCPWWGVYANLAAGDKTESYGPPQPKAREGWFSWQLLGLALLWMPSQPYLFLPRPEMNEQKCHFILSWVLLGSLTHIPRFLSGSPLKVWWCSFSHQSLSHEL